MITKEELRIGNYVSINRIERKVKNTDFIQASFELKLNPIKLTEEWLLKFGFDLITKGSDESGYIKEYYLLDNLTIVYDENFDLSICSDLGICPFLKNFKLVHQLQNLYFALTGEELTTN